MTNEGIKISLEGIDGVGKTTQAALLQDHLISSGHDVFFKPCWNNYYSDDIGNDVLKIMRESRDELREIPAAEVLLNAARSMFIHQKHVQQYLENGWVVLCDRDVDTALAYSMPGLRNKYPERQPASLTKWMLGVYAIESTIPDLTILFDADTPVALNRAMSDEVPNERAIFDENGVAFITEVQTYYRELSTLFPDRIKRIDVNHMSIADVSGQVNSVVDLFIDERRKV